MDKQAWAKAAYDVLVKVATLHEEFTPDDIWAAGLEKPLEARALGGVMRRAKEEGLIEKTGRVRPTTQPESHGTDVTIWKSKIFKG
ncbi:hypothetical protein [Pectobacterium aroidearum]|uniref:hypothetical protein n=1 Tax=Pectobacterium aroidearum TaxID=1201031 RepID=UPI0032EE4779